MLFTNKSIISSKKYKKNAREVKNLYLKTYLLSTSKAFSGVSGFPYISLPNVTIVSAPIITSGGLLKQPILVTLSETSKTFCNAVSSTKSLNDGKSSILRFSSKRDGHSSTFIPWNMIKTKLVSLIRESCGFYHTNLFTSSCLLGEPLARIILCDVNWFRIGFNIFIIYSFKVCCF